ATDKSQREMARFMGLDPSAITLMFQGRRAMQLTEAQQIAQFLGVAIEDVLRNAGLELSGTPKPADGRQGAAHQQAGSQSQSAVPLAGTIDAKGELHLDLKGAKQTIDIPLRLPPGAVAVRAAGDVFPPTVMRGALIFFRPGEAVEPAAIGRLAVLRLGNKKLCLAHVAPGFELDRYNLTDSGGGKENITLVSATPVLWIKP
ncbi:MAG: helix-turn-helix transcriptional regulator, partial [Dongiaceae bacterium]